MGLQYPKISVIVPVYNAGQYLEQCIQSILDQTFTDFELILVDDGSTDGSLLSCNRLALNDKRISVLHQKNNGAMSARKKGLEHSKGEYICFVDADDLLIENTLKILISNMNNDIDVVVSEASFNGIVTQEIFLKGLLKCEFPVTLWGKLFKRNILFESEAMNIDKIFDIGEDYLSNIKIALHTHNVYCFSDCVYIYRDNQSSIMHNRTYSLDYEEKFVFEVKKLIFEKLNELEDAWYQFRFRTLEGMVTNNVKFTYSIPWIKQLVEEKTNCSLSRRAKLIRLTHNWYICRLIFLLLDKRVFLKKIFARIKKCNRI